MKGRSRRFPPPFFVFCLRLVPKAVPQQKSEGHFWLVDTECAALVPNHHLVRNKRNRPCPTVLVDSCRSPPLLASGACLFDHHKIACSLAAATPRKAPFPHE